MKKTVGTRLKELRSKKHLTQAEVARAIGISTSAIAMYERDERVPRDTVKVKLAEFFGKTVANIFFAG